VKIIRKKEDSFQADTVVLEGTDSLSSLKNSAVNNSLESSSVADPGSRMGKKSRSGSGMNIPNHISESLETVFGLEILKSFYVDPDPGGKDSNAGSATLESCLDSGCI
jgi:hypothetical protein